MRKIIRAFKKNTNNCIKKLTGFNFFQPTITKQIKGSYKKTLKFLKKKKILLSKVFRIQKE